MDKHFFISPVRPGGARWGPVGPGGARWGPMGPGGANLFSVIPLGGFVISERESTNLRDKNSFLAKFLFVGE